MSRNCSALCTLRSALCVRRCRSASGLTLIEILIAMFIFLIGIVGILAVFPVAMNSAGRAITEARSNVLAQTAIAQLTADCRVNYEPALSGGYASINSSSDNAHFARLNPVPLSAARVGYFVTLVSNDPNYPGKGQSRLITADDGTTVTITPGWTPVGATWTQPANSDTYVITRMGLPEPPAIPPATGYAYGTYGLNRDLVIRTFAPPNGFYAGIADWTISPPSARPFQAEAGTWAGGQPTGEAGYVPGAFTNSYGTSLETGAATGGTLGSLTRTGAGWPLNQFEGKYLCLTSGAGFGQVRTITSNTADTLTVSPSFSTSPLSTDNYLITNGCGYMVRLVSGSGAGQVRPVVGNTATQLFVTPNWNFTDPSFTAPAYEVGWANAAPTWCRQLGPLYTSTGASITTLTSGGAGWTPGQHAGMYVYIAASGQARAIVSNSADTLTVTPSFTVVPAAGTNYQIMESHGYVLIASGKATGRILPIVWDALDNANGHLIVCAGADFTSFGVTPAQSGGQYNLQNGTTFTVIGNQQPLQASSSVPLLLNVLPWSRTDLPIMNPLIPILNPLNVIGGIPLARTNTPYRIAPDEYGDYVDGHGTANQQQVTSDFGYAVIFSDNGTDPTLPVRVDAFVWRNFDTNKDFAQNQKPVGHMAGYIRRP